MGRLGGPCPTNKGGRRRESPKAHYMDRWQNRLTTPRGAAEQATGSALFLWERISNESLVAACSDCTKRRSGDRSTRRSFGFGSVRNGYLDGDRPTGTSPAARRPR